MNIAGDLLIVEERLARQRQPCAQGRRGCARRPTHAPTADHRPRACKRDHDRPHALRARPAADGRRPLLAELLERNAVWIPSTPDWWTAPGRILAAEPCEAHTHSSAPSAGALRIAQGCAYDPGNAVYRYHTAFNEHTKHASAYVHWQKTATATRSSARSRSTGWPTPPPRARTSGPRTCCTITSTTTSATPGLGPKPRRDQLVIRHYHGSLPAGPGVVQHPLRRTTCMKDDALGALLLGARLTLCALRPDRMHWLPIPVPVARYRPWCQRRAGRARSGSPTRRRRPSTRGRRPFLDVCDRLNKRGVKVEPVLIGMKRGRAARAGPEVARRGAAHEGDDCDAVFDSFWLGIAGQRARGRARWACRASPAIPTSRRSTADTIGRCRTRSRTTRRTRAAIERLATDALRARGGERSNEYVRRYHDYPRVAERYEGILAKALGRDDVRTA
jgi:hypothetical protein